MTACGPVMTILLCVCFKINGRFCLRLCSFIVLSSQPPLSGRLLVFRGWAISGGSSISHFILSGWNYI